MYMPMLGGGDLAAAETISRLCYANPFLPERVELEARALGAQYEHVHEVWTLRHGLDNPNVEPLRQLTARLVDAARTKLAGGHVPSKPEAALYLDLVRYRLFSHFEDELLALVRDANAGVVPKGRLALYDDVAHEAVRLLERTPNAPKLPGGVRHHFACVFQARRAFALVHEHILGASPAAIALRAATWRSIFTHDAARYQRALFDTMHDIPTLVVGPSGTGKELVARAIGLSRYVPFDAKAGRFEDEQPGTFVAVNIAALAASVIESELFGHRRGAFTGAAQDRVGWLELATDHGTLFLDEIGELDALIQAKLLRVLQTREFQRVGDTQSRRFGGKVIAATNRDLAEEMREGRFREDFYYRLCADVVMTPPLQAQLRERPEDLSVFVEHAVRRIVACEEVEAVTHDVVAWIRDNLGDDYTWPGNVRELEQCVRSVIVRRDYRPAGAPIATDARGRLGRSVAAGRMTAEQVLDAYCTLVYADAGSFKEAARRLGIDRRTVKARLDSTLLAELGGVATDD